MAILRSCLERIPLTLKRTQHPHWQEMGALEGVAGVLMFGISTAYMFSLCNFTCQRYTQSGGTEAFMER